jgi:hypothetical protein
MMEKRRRVVELRDQGKTLAQISEEMKLSIGVVRNHLAKASASASPACPQPLAVRENEG